MIFLILKPLLSAFFDILLGLLKFAVVVVVIGFALEYGLGYAVLDQLIDYLIKTFTAGLL